MKKRKTHTGIYSCPDCGIEFELTNEASLKCDACEGTLKKGSLEDVAEDDDEDDFD